MAKKKNKKKGTKFGTSQKQLRAHQMERRLETAAERDSNVAAFLQDFAKASAASGDEAAYTNSFLSAIKALKPEIGQARKWAQKKIEKDLKITDKELAMFQEKKKGKKRIEDPGSESWPREPATELPDIEPQPWPRQPATELPPYEPIAFPRAPSTEQGPSARIQKWRQRAGVSYDPSMYQAAPNSDRRLASLARYREALPRIARLKARMALNDPSLRAFGNATRPNVGRSGVPLAYDPNSPFPVRKNY
jgi:hypothetical protein